MWGSHTWGSHPATDTDCAPLIRSHTQPAPPPKNPSRPTHTGLVCTCARAVLPYQRWLWLAEVTKVRGRGCGHPAG